MGKVNSMSKQITTHLRLVADQETTTKFLLNFDKHLAAEAGDTELPRIQVSSLLEPTPHLSIDELETIIDSVLEADPNFDEANKIIKLLKSLIVNNVYVNLGLPPKYTQCEHCEAFFVDEGNLRMCTPCQPLYYEDAL